MPSKVQTTLKFAAAVSRERDSRAAGSAVAQAARRDLEGRQADLACLFFSPQYAESAEELVEAVRQELSPRLLIGCSGEGVIGGGEEIESAAAVTLWTASLPGVALTPFRLSADQDEYGISMTGWPGNFDESLEHPSFLLLADPFSTPMDEVFSHLADRCSGAPAIGGLAGGGRDQGDNAARAAWHGAGIRLAPSASTARIRKALPYVDPGRLFPCTDCGLVPRTRPAARAKLRALVEGAQMVRREIGVSRPSAAGSLRSAASEGPPVLGE